MESATVTGVAEPFLAVSRNSRAMLLLPPSCRNFSNPARAAGATSRWNNEPRSVASGTPAISPKARLPKQNGAAGFEQCGAVTHRVQQHEVRMRGAIDGQRLRTAGTGNDERVHLSRADRFEGRFGLLQPTSERGRRRAPLGRDTFSLYGHARHVLMP